MDYSVEGWVTGWTNIAKYCDRSISTVKRWHYRLGMPVHKGLIAPTIIPAEVNEWLKRANGKCTQNRTQMNLKKYTFNTVRSFDRE